MVSARLLVFSVCGNAEDRIPARWGPTAQPMAPRAAHSGPLRAYLASAHGAHAVCAVARLQAEGAAPPQLLVPQFHRTSFFGPR